MKILVTGGFGNVGLCVVDELLRRGHDVTVLEMASKRTKRLGRHYRPRLSSVLYGDIRDLEFVVAAVDGQEAIVHMAAILPPTSETNPKLCDEVNVGGTRNVVAAVRQTNPDASLVLVSSVAAAAYRGISPTSASTSDDAASDMYGRSKASAEEVVHSARLRSCVLRLSAVLPSRGGISLDMARMIFDLPQQALIETVMDVDVALAIANVVERLTTIDGTIGKTYVIAGGKECRVTGADVVSGLLGAVGLPAPDARLFNEDVQGFSLGWQETDDSEHELTFQRHTFADYRKHLARKLALIRPFVRMFRRPISSRIAKLSPNYR